MSRFVFRTARSEPWRRVAGPVVLAVAATVVGLLMTSYKYLDRVANGVSVDFRVPLIEELTSSYSAALLLYLLVRPFARRVRRVAGNTAFTVAAHTLCALAFSAVHTSANWGMRKAVFALAGLEPYDYGRMPARFAMELPVDIIVFVLFVAGLHALWRYREGRVAELTAAHLQAKLLEAQLRNLRGQLEPHFLFNALNTVSSVMYDNPAAADEMLSHLASLLRASLSTGGAQITTLRAELEMLDHYLALLRSRFADRLTVKLAIEDATLARRVPSLILQPLVENAVRHGGVERSGRGTITIAAAITNGLLRIDVTDDGPGTDPSAGQPSAGIGLSATRDRLHLIYGYDDQMQAGNVTGGGFRVRLMLEDPPEIRASTGGLM